MLTINTTAKVLELTSKPWEIEGRSGVSHNVRFLAGDEIFKAKSTEELNKTLEKFVGKSGNATLELTSPREATKLSIVAFDVK